MSGAAAFAAVWVALFTAHQVFDHWGQTGHQAATKGAPGRAGAWACAQHVAVYTAGTALFTAGAVLLLDLPVTPLGFLAGQFISAATHYWADRRYTLRALADFLRLGALYDLGRPRPGRDDNPSLGTGAYALDQSFHQLFLFAAALLTVIV